MKRRKLYVAERRNTERNKIEVEMENLKAKTLQRVRRESLGSARSHKLLALVNYD